MPEHRGRGPVDFVLSHLVEQAKLGGAIDLRLYASNTNRRALGAYQRFGFHEAPYLIMTKSLAGE